MSKTVTSKSSIAQKIILSSISTIFLVVFANAWIGNKTITAQTSDLSPTSDGLISAPTVANTPIPLQTPIPTQSSPIFKPPLGFGWLKWKSYWTALVVDDSIILGDFYNVTNIDEKNGNLLWEINYQPDRNITIHGIAANTNTVVWIEQDAKLIDAPMIRGTNLNNIGTPWSLSVPISYTDFPLNTFSGGISVDAEQIYYFEWRTGQLMAFDLGTKKLRWQHNNCTNVFGLYQDRLFANCDPDLLSELDTQTGKTILQIY